MLQTIYHTEDVQGYEPGYLEMILLLTLQSKSIGKMWIIGKFLRDDTTGI